MASNKIERGHQMYRDGLYKEALGFYTEAIAMAKTNPQKIALHSNRAACFLKLHDFKKAAEECTSVLELDSNHSGALMLRAQTLVTLKEYHSALFDVNRLLELNPSSEVYQNLYARLKTQLESHLLQYLSQKRSLKNRKMRRLRIDQKVELGKGVISIECTPKETDPKFSSKQERDQKYEPKQSTEELKIPRALNNESAEQGWQTIPKPKGHSALDYARWDSVDNDSSEDDEDDDDESFPQYRFRVKTIGVRPVK
ncbi:hypothetical protein KIW84_010241 [Lathyrus oleraceus]|uniref:Uncharacterized protein n=2 Tax=Pisum sativum TaxID=3888 RepID=A0A9D4YPB9_PEA|nr:hypothetical protein KIW84_010241 [Pisum sativum]